MAIENPRQDIRETPQFPILEFGDGYIALMIGAIAKQAEDGRVMMELYIEPGKSLKKWYNITEDMLDNNHRMNFIVAQDDLIPLNQFDVTNMKWLYIKTFTHQKTNISEIESSLRKRLEQAQKDRVVLEGELGWAYEQLELAKSNPQEFAAQAFDLIDKMGQSSVFGLQNRNKQDEQGGHGF